MPNWTKKKPDFACVFITRDKFKDEWEYNLWRLEWAQGEAPDDADEDRWYYYLAWLDADGDEFDAWEDSKDWAEYLIIERLPTRHQVFLADVERERKYHEERMEMETITK